MCFLIAYMARYHSHGFCNPQHTSLLHLATSLLADLDIDLPADRFSREMSQLFNMRFARRPPSLRTMSERRALLGCYFTNNV